MSFAATGRRPNTNRGGGSFSPDTVQRVWEKGRIVSGYDPAQYRQDMCGYWIARSDYGNTNSQYGWEVDHIMPASRGGSDDLTNLQPLQWGNNRRKGDTYPWSC